MNFHAESAPTPRSPSWDDFYGDSSFTLNAPGHGAEMSLGKPVIALSPPKRNSTRRHPNLTDNAIRRVTDCIISATRHAKTCKTKVRSKWKRKINYAGYAAWIVAANGNLWTIADLVVVAARRLPAGSCKSWAEYAGTARCDLFARHRTARRRPLIGITRMKAERRQNAPAYDSVGHMLSASNMRGVF